MIDVHEYVDDSRGGKIEKFKLDCSDTDATALVRGPSVIADQLMTIFERRGLRQQPLEIAQRPEWTHRFAVPQDLVDRFERALKFFSEVLVIPSEDPLRSLVALDFYKTPVPGTDSHSWPNTGAGELIYQGKYCQSKSAESVLIQRLVRIVKVHPWYRSGGEVVVSTPGTETTFSSRLAEGVANELNLPLVNVESLSDERVPSKSASRQDLDLTHEFVVNGQVDGRIAILVDDVYMTGRTMRSISATLRDSGARMVLGLVGARTLKSR